MYKISEYLKSSHSISIPINKSSKELQDIFLAATKGHSNTKQPIFTKALSNKSFLFEFSRIDKERYSKIERIFYGDDGSEYTILCDIEDADKDSIVIIKCYNPIILELLIQIVWLFFSIVIGIAISSNFFNSNLPAIILISVTIFVIGHYLFRKGTSKVFIRNSCVIKAIIKKLILSAPSK